MSWLSRFLGSEEEDWSAWCNEDPQEGHQSLEEAALLFHGVVDGGFPASVPCSLALLDGVVDVRIVQHVELPVNFRQVRDVPP